MLTKTLLVILGAIALVVGGFWAGDLVGAAPAAASVSLQPVSTQPAFDRGMKAGVDYESWFCMNTVTPSK